MLELSSIVSYAHKLHQKVRGTNLGLVLLRFKLKNSIELLDIFGQNFLAPHGMTGQMFNVIAYSIVIRATVVYFYPLITL